MRFEGHLRSRMGGKRDFETCTLKPALLESFVLSFLLRYEAEDVSVFLRCQHVNCSLQSEHLDDRSTCFSNGPTLNKQVGHLAC